MCACPKLLLCSLLSNVGSPYQNQGICHRYLTTTADRQRRDLLQGKLAQGALMSRAKQQKSGKALGPQQEIIDAALMHSCDSLSTPSPKRLARQEKNPEICQVPTASSRALQDLVRAPAPRFGNLAGVKGGKSQLPCQEA